MMIRIHGHNGMMIEEIFRKPMTTANQEVYKIFSSSTSSLYSLFLRSIQIFYLHQSESTDRTEKTKENH